MKKNIFILGFVVLTCHPILTSALSTSTVPIDSFYYKNHIKLVQYGLLLGSYTISYERAINVRNSVDIHIGYRYNTGNVVPPFWYSYYSDTFNWEIQGYMIATGYRYYLSHMHNFRLFVSPFFRHCHLNEKTFWQHGHLYEQTFINSYATGATFGGQLLRSRVTFDFFL